MPACQWEAVNEFHVILYLCIQLSHCTFTCTFVHTCIHIHIKIHILNCLYLNSQFLTLLPFPRPTVGESGAELPSGLNTNSQTEENAVPPWAKLVTKAKGLSICVGRQFGPLETYLQILAVCAEVLTSR